MIFFFFFFFFGRVHPKTKPSLCSITADLGKIKTRNKDKETRHVGGDGTGKNHTAAHSVNSLISSRTLGNNTDTQTHTHKHTHTTTTRRLQ